VSKAFTKEDDDGGFTPPPSSTSVSIPEGAFRVTATGARRLATSSDPRVRDALARAEVLPPQIDPVHAALGVTVHVRRARGQERAYRLVTPEEYALLGEGVTVGSPLGRALLGAAVGDVCEVRDEALEVLALDGESS
jgi:transcription elongation GreA/GreB family factor